MCTYHQSVIMRAITTSNLLLLASVCAWHLGNAAVTVAADDNNFGIFGGKQVNITDAPFMAQLVTEAGGLFYFCGACIVHEQFLLTAGYCILDEPTSRTVMVGSDWREKGEEYEVEKILFHPKFSNNSMDYDLSVIKLKKKLNVSERVKPIKMADSSLVLKPGEVMEAIGFGRKEDNYPSKRLFGVHLPYMERDKCKEAIRHKVTNQQICAGGEEGKGVCHQDIGGPLFRGDTLVGVVSYFITKGIEQRCGVFPDVFSYVPSMRDFIDGVIKNNGN